MDKKQRPVAIERVRGQFAQWRAHKSKSDRIPDHLWRAAIEVAQRHGVHAVSRALRRKHSALRRRVEKTARYMGDAVREGVLRFRGELIVNQLTCRRSRTSRRADTYKMHTLLT